jgi:uncharacterized membrane protein
MSDTTTSAIEATVTILSAALAAAAAAATTYVLAHRRTSDRNTMKFVRRVFDRPAFRGPFSWQTDPQPYHRALGLTIKALNSGVLQDRQGTELAKGSPLSAIRRRAWRQALADVPSRLKDISNHVEEYKQPRVRDQAAALQIDSERDEVIRRLNVILVAAGLDSLPIPSKWSDNASSYERD